MSTKSVIYARFSSSAQREESIDTQIRECLAYAQKHDMVVVNVYQDKAKSGRTANRPSFQKMIKDSENHTFDAVLLYTLDRFARNRFDAAYYKAKLKDNGVKVHYVKQDIGDGPESILLESMMEGYAEYYSASLSRAVKAGLEENAIHCVFTGGKIPYGFYVDENHKLAIQEDEAAIIRRAYEQYANGMSKTEIANYNNSRGYRTRSGKKFSEGFFNRILQSEKYRGVYLYSTFRTEGGIPAIIDERLWNRCQLRRHEVRKVRSKYKAKEIYLLTPNVYCGCCGANMYGESGTSRNGKIHTYYKCISKKKHRQECSKRNERKDELEDVVIGLIEEHLLTDENVRWIAETCVGMIDNEQKNDPERIALERNIAEKEKALQNGWKAVENGYNSMEYFERLKQLEEDKKELEKQLAVLKANDIPLTVDDIILFLETIKKRPEEFPDYRRFLCDTLINRVVLTDTSDGTQITIICNVTDKQKTPEPCGSDVKQLVDWCTEHPNTLTEHRHPLVVAFGGYYKADH